MLKPKSLDAKSVSEILLRLQDEVNAQYFYLTAKNYARANGFSLAEAFYEKESLDEAKHAQIWIDFLVDYNVNFVIPVPTAKPNFLSLVDIIEKTYVIENTLRIDYGNTSQNFFKSSDMTCFNKSLEFIAIQDESTIDASDRLNRLDSIDTSKINLLLLEETLFGEEQ